MWGVGVECGVWGVGCGVWGEGCGVWDQMFGVWGLGSEFGICGIGCGVLCGVQGIGGTRARSMVSTAHGDASLSATFPYPLRNFSSPFP